MNNDERSEIIENHYRINSTRSKYVNFEHLLKSRGLNGAVELSGLKLTRWQVEGLRDYIVSDNVYKFIFKTIDEYGLKIVDSYKESDLSI